MQPVRVLLVAPSPDIVGGQSVQASTLLRALQSEPAIELDFEPINPKFAPPLSLLQKPKYFRTAVTECLYTSNLFRRAKSCDVLHVFVAGYSSFLLTFLPVLSAARIYGKPVILNYHDGRAEDHLIRSPTALRLVRAADRLVVPSEFLVEVFRHFKLPASAIFNIISPDMFLFRERRAITPKFLHNRGLEAHYNVPCTLRAFALVQERYPAATLTVAHDGPLRSQLESMPGAMGLRNVRFTGAVAPERMRDLYDDADIYLMSPDIDNMPLSVLECFASGLPVISTNVGGVPFLVESNRTGLLVPPNDHSAMAACAFRLLEEEGLACFLAQNARKESERYRAEAVVPRWIAAYREVSCRKPA